ncbi:EAL domain-containing protein [Thiomicrorhabdus lithotrophica]|uniref:EAL domain-containing protein n=1 Tax=Thiomicrorhabdus lithotrophica TaxID=2949997 RepID=A0ABY8CAQ1_9GAMM|nr:EAL domain-containing protein [Thiomicrorhabdus lithotrophica]WEJ62312.1 EAL domain-containing protein [Thiomicrorhabdus lithotrophica]
MLKKLYAHSIKRKLILAIAGLHAVLMTIFVIDLVHRQQSFLMQESHVSTSGIAKTLAANSTPWVLSNDLVGLEEIIRSQDQQPNFQFAMITDSNGKILAYHHSKNHTKDLIGKSIKIEPLDIALKNKELAIFSDTKTKIDVAAPIKVNDSLIGWARIHMARDNIYDSIRVISIEGILYTLFAILIGSIFAWRMGSNLTKGIYELIHTTQRVRAGERKITLSLKRKDELQILSDNFQSMLTSLSEKERELYAEKERLEITLMSIGDGVITTDMDGLVTYLNPVAEHLTGWSNHAARGFHIEEVFKIYHELTMDPAENPALKSMATQKITLLANHTVLLNRAGEKISIEDSGAPIIDKSGKIIGAVLVFHDATEARQLRKRLTWQAQHDTLTQLANRQAFETKLDDLISKSIDSPQNQHCLIYIDLDQFKIVNDTVGHAAGDELLKQVASILQQQVRDSDLLARIGGDEFAIVLENCSTSNAEQVAEKVRQVVHNHRFTWNDRIFDIGTSIGIAQMKGLINKANVMSQADVACYIAKEQGRNRVHIFKEDDQVLAREFNNLDWANRIKRAIEDEQFVLYAQKITPLQHIEANETYEVLIRLQPPEGELIFPDQFLPAAERFNLMGELDIYIVKRAYKWLKNNFNNVKLLNINISGQSLDDDKFNNALLELLEKDSKINQKICFEITETTAITHMSASISFLNRIKNHGCSLALDDFGSGFSSFGWLKTLPVDYVKIDGTFVLDVLTDSVDAAMVKAIHSISEEMDIKTIAEFVENQAVSDWLKETGIDYAQGYHFSRPNPLINI